MKRECRKARRQMKKRISIVLLTIALTLGQVAPVYATGSNSVLTTDVAEIIAEEQVEEATTEAVTQSMEEESVSVSTTETVMSESEMSVENDETDIVESSEATVEKTEDNSADMTEMADVENAENVISEASYATMNLALDDETGDELLALTNLEWSKEKPFEIKFYNPNDVDVRVLIEFQYGMYNVEVGACETGTLGLNIIESGEYAVKTYVFPSTVDFSNACMAVRNGNYDESIVTISPTYSYVLPDEQLPIPENLVFTKDGIVTWDAIESEYVLRYQAYLYEVTNDNQHRIITGFYKFPTDELKVDFSYYTNSGKKYCVKFSTVSSNLEKICDSEVYEIYMTDDSNKDELLPLTNLEWSEEQPFTLQFYNPNDVDVSVYIGNSLVGAYRQIQAHKTDTVDFSFYDYQSGNYVVKAYVIPKTMSSMEEVDQKISSGTYDESLIAVSPAYSYVRPEEQLPIPNNIVFNEDGIVTWDAIENEYVESYAVMLWDITNGYSTYVSGVEKPTYELLADFSQYIESGKKYAVSFYVYSSNIEKICASGYSEDIYMTGNPNTGDDTSGDDADKDELLPLTNLEWDNEGTVGAKFYNPNDVSVCVMFKCQNLMMPMMIDAHETEMVNLSFISENGDYTFETYVLPTATSMEDAYEKYSNGTYNESLVSVSPVYSYVRPEEGLPIPNNIVFKKDGIITWDAVENEYVDYYYVALYLVPIGTLISSDTTENLEYDFSKYMESGYQYCIKISARSSNIKKIYHSETSEYIYMTDDSGSGDSNSGNSGTDAGETPDVTPSDKPTETPDVTPNDKPTETPIVTQKPSTDENKSNDTGVNHTEKTTYQKTEEVTIVEEIVPLAADVEKVGFEYVDLKMNQKTAKLKKELLAKYYGRQTQLMVHMGNKIGYSIDTAILSKEQNDVSLAASVNTLDNFAEGFTTMHIKPSTATVLNQSIGIHLNAGVEHAGKVAFIFARNLETNTMEFVQAVTVNEIGNVSLMSNEITDVVVMIQE